MNIVYKEETIEKVRFDKLEAGMIFKLVPERYGNIYMKIKGFCSDEDSFNAICINNASSFILFNDEDYVIPVVANLVVE